MEKRTRTRLETRAPGLSTLLLLLLAALFLQPVAAQPEKSEEPKTEKEKANGILIRQKANGLPGRPANERHRQTVRIKDRLIRIDERKSPIYSIVDLDGEIIYEIDPGKKEYMTRSFDYFRKLRRDKKKKNDELFRRKDRFDDETWERILKKNGLRDDRKIVATVKRTGKKETVDLGGKPVKIEQVQVFKNGLLVYDLWVTKEYERPEALMELYEELGAFPKEVVQATKRIEGQPIDMKVVIDLGTLRSDVDLRVTELYEGQKFADALFEIPDGFKEVGELSRFKESKKPKGKICAVDGCDKKYDPRINPIREPGRGDHYFCSKKHWKKWLRANRD